MKKWKWILALSLVLVCSSACSKEEVVEEITEEVTEEPEVLVIEEVEEELPANTNLLTGVLDLSDEAVGMRPVAVMVSNVDAAMPQYGISEADIIIEMPVEGYLTRFMALYADYTQVPDICSVRSCRDYFPSISEGFDAFYIHWGIDESIRSHYEEMELDKFDGTYSDGGIFSRDSDRLDSGYATEHTGMMSGGEVLVAAIEDAEMRTELLEEKTDTAFLFNSLDESVVPTGDICMYANVDFGATTAGFTYDETEQVYYKDYNGDVQADGVTGIQLSFTNVFVLECTITQRTDSPGRVAIDCYGVSDQVGYYISNGVVQEIRWSKADEYSDLIFYDLSGEELSINCGKSYIAFNYADQATFE